MLLAIQADTPELLDGAGDAYHITGLTWRQDYNQSSTEYGHHKREVFSACPTAALYSREEFLKVQSIDEDYFSYFEDVDLGFRLRFEQREMPVCSRGSCPPRRICKHRQTQRFFRLLWLPQHDLDLRQKHACAIVLDFSAAAYIRRTFLCWLPHPARTGQGHLESNF